MSTSDRQTSDDVGRLRKALQKLADAIDEETLSRGAVEVSLEDRYRDRTAHRRLENAYIAAVCATSEAVRQARAALKGVPQPASSPDAARLEEVLIAAYTRGANWAWENTESSKEYVGKAARDYADFTMNAPASEAGKLSTDEVQE